MTEAADINDLIRFAMGDSMWVSQERRRQIEERYGPSRVALFDRILAACDEPLEAWTTAHSLAEAAAIVERGLRSKYPELTDESLGLLLSHAAFSWK